MSNNGEYFDNPEQYLPERWIRGKLLTQTCRRTFKRMETPSLYSFFLYICQSMCLSVCLYVYFSAYPFVCPYVYLSVCLSVRPSFCLISLLLCLSVPVWLSFCLFRRLHICLSNRLFVRLSFCTSVYLISY